MKTGEVPVFTYEHGTTADLGTVPQGTHQGAISWLIPPNRPKGARTEVMKISDEIYRDLHNGAGFMMVYGMISYDSVFGALHNLDNHESVKLGEVWDETQ
jgi:hypothetical protein